MQISSEFDADDERIRFALRPVAFEPNLHLARKNAIGNKRKNAATRRANKVSCNAIEETLARDGIARVEVDTLHENFSAGDCSGWINSYDSRGVTHLIRQLTRIRKANFSLPFNS